MSNVTMLLCACSFLVDVYGLQCQYNIAYSIVCRLFGGLGSTPNNLENPITFPGFSAVVAMTTVHFISGSFETGCEIPGVM